MNSCKDQKTELVFSKNLWFLNKIENDFSYIFEYLKNIVGGNIFFAKSMLKKCNNKLKGDYFLSLRSNCALVNYKEKLTAKLNEYSYIHNTYIDEHENLIMCLNRSLVYKNVLYDVMKYEKYYGMQRMDNPYFVVVHNRELNDFDALRVTLLADHLISFLTVNGATVFTNDFTENFELFVKKTHTYACTSQCVDNRKLLLDLIKNAVVKAHERQELKKYILREKDSFVIKGNQYVETYSLSSRFGNDVGDIKLFADNESEVLKKSAYTSHYFMSHRDEHDMSKMNAIFHVSLHGEKHKIIQSGLLTEILDLDMPIHVPVQKFIDCQKVHLKHKSNITVKEFIDYQKRDIIEAMSHKCGMAELEDDVQEKNLAILVDTVVKFTFLKSGFNACLNINFSSNKSSTKNDGVFIQYNFARLSTLLKTFELKVEQKYYKPLPMLDEIDFTLLREKEEWDLLSFLLSFPSLVEEICFSLDMNQLFQINKMAAMLSKLSHLFSLYYSRIRILASPQLHLQKVMHARLWLLKGVHQVMCNSFMLLNIEGLRQM